jgi:DNA-binding LacI/PurR family transcriptional regulator
MISIEKVRIEDVAREAQVSKSTVSRVFAHPEIVNEVTKEHVLAAARELGYRPRRGPGARQLLGTIGLVVPDVGTPFFQMLMAGASAEAESHRCTLFVSNGGASRRTEFPVVRSLEQHVDGVILASSQLRDEDILELQTRVPVVAVNREVDGVPSVILRSDAGMASAVEHLAALGHRRIAYVAGSKRVRATGERREALLSTAGRLGVDVLELGPFDEAFDAGVSAADLVLAAGCTATIAFNDVLALGVIARANDVGVVVGRDLSVIGFDGLWFGIIASPPLTTVAAPAAQAGSAAARELLHIVNGAGPSSSQELQGELIVRSSTGPPAPSLEAVPNSTDDSFRSARERRVAAET